MTEIHTDETLNGIDPSTTLSPSEQKLENGLSYVSKSRIKTYKQCPFKFFHQFGKDPLRKMLFKAAMHKDEEGRVVVEFSGEKALNVTEHVEELELEQ